MLFHDTIFYNIQYGNMAATVSEVYEAAKMAEMHSVVTSMPNKYNTQVGERGLKLSGKQLCNKSDSKAHRCSYKK